MIFLFFPTMGIRTPILIVTSATIHSNEISAIPVQALLLIICEKVWFSSEILPIVGKNTHISSMLVLVIWTPNGFKMKKIEVNISFHFVNHIN
jgi:hypothetical protein